MEQLFARRDRSMWRVFADNWGDRFEMMELSDFEKFQGYLKRFGMDIIILEHEEEPSDVV